VDADGGRGKTGDSVAGARLSSALAQLQWPGPLWSAKRSQAVGWATPIQVQRLSSPLATRSLPKEEIFALIKIYNANYN
jgi:hypothetical protein